jgi:hypothetical protein
MNTQPTLEQRIGDALQPDTAITSADIAALIDEAEAGIHGRSDTIARSESSAAGDSGCGLRRESTRMLLSKLQVRHQQVHSREQATAWLARYDVMKRKRDALADELNEVYPDPVIKIVDLFVRIIDNNEALSELHQDRPAGVMEHLDSAELHARGLDRFTRDAPSLLTSLCLFDWDSGRQI